MRERDLLVSFYEDLHLRRNVLNLPGPRVFINYIIREFLTAINLCERFLILAGEHELAVKLRMQLAASFEASVANWPHKSAGRRMGEHYLPLFTCFPNLSGKKEHK